MGELHKRRVLVTGGLGGIGTAICTTFATQGWSVLFTYRYKHERAQEFVEKLREISSSDITSYQNSQVATCHQSIELDLLKRIDGTHLRSKISNFGQDNGLSCLVNCAGYTRYVEHSRLDLLDDELIDTILNTNIKAPVVLIRELLPLLQQSKQSSIINITSIAAKIANGSNIVYCASKSALENMTRSLARALAPNIRVFSVAPGLLDTHFITEPSEYWWKTQIDNTPLKRLASPKSVADAVYFACNNMLDSTGTTLEIDGGRPL